MILTGRRAEQLAVMAGELENEFGVEVLTLCFDVRDRDAVKRAAPADLPKPGAFRKAGEQAAAPAETPAEEAPAETTNEGGEA